MADPTLYLPNPSGIIGGVTRNPLQEQNTDGTQVTASLGRHGHLHTADIHGQYFAATGRGAVFSACAAGGTGVAILAPGGTTAGFMFYNPVGTGMNMEILEICAAPKTATDVVDVIGLEYGTVPSAVGTADTVISQLIGGTSQTAQGKAAHGSTIAAMTVLRWLPIFVQTTAGVMQGSMVTYQPNGSLVLAPGGAINIMANPTTQGTNLWMQHVIWAEWPI